MELLDLPQLAERADIAISLARYYRERFVLFVPSVRIGRSVLHPPEAVGVIQRIHAEARDGATVDAIIQMLETASPISITSAQPLADDGAVPGAAGVINALASAFDERGERIEQQLVGLRESLEATATAAHIGTIWLEAKGMAEEAVTLATTEVARLKQEIVSVRAAIGDLASRDQMEWIGDVVAAAVIAPTPTSIDPNIEQRLTELQAEIRRLRPSTDAAELRVAVERLTDYVHHRDAELRRAFQTLVGTLRTEIHGLRGAMDDLRMVASTEAGRDPYAPIPFPTPTSAGLFPDDPLAGDRSREMSIEALRSRSPRRLGQQPAKPADGQHGDTDHAGGAASAPAT